MAAPDLTYLYQLDDESRFVKVLDLTVPWAHSYADMTPGKTDRERRENYRTAADPELKPIPASPRWWAFRITVLKSGRQMDVDNVAKTIIDSFSRSQLRRDASPFARLGLFEDDTFDYVRVLQVVGVPGDVDRTRIEVFARIAE